MAESKLFIKYLDIEDTRKVDNIDFIICRNRKEYIKYTKAFMEGFHKPRRRFFAYFFNCFDRKYEMFLVKKEGKIVGCFALRLKGPKTVYLYDFTVLPNYRGCGLSRDVLNMVYNIVLKKNKNKLCLYVKKTNHIALNLYKSEGFVEYIKGNYK